MIKDVTVGLDIDGVVYDYHRALYVFMQCENDYPGSLSEFWETYVPSLSEEVQDYLVSIPMPYEICVPSNDVLESMDRLATVVKEIYYVTSRDPELERVTVRFLNKYKFPFKENLVIEKKKDLACVRHGIDFFLDDMGKHVRDVSKVCKGFLKAAIHNKSYRDKFDTVYSIDEFNERIQNETSRR